MNHPSLNAISQGYETAMGMGRETLRQNKFFLKFPEWIKGREGMRVMDEHDKWRSCRCLVKVWANPPPESFFQLGDD